MLISPASPFGPRHEYRDVDFEERRDAYDGWHRYNTNYVQENFRGFAEWFNGNCINEPHSTKQVEDMVAWTMETTPATMIDAMRAPDIGAGDEETFRRIRCPLLFLHGDNDLNQPVAKPVIWPHYATDGCGFAGVGPCSPGPHPGQGQPDPQGLHRRDRGERWRCTRRNGPPVRKHDGRQIMTRARYPDQEGRARNGDVKLHYEVYGAGEPTVLLLPTWQIVHSRKWKGQIATLARHYRVVTFDGRGSGKSDRPLGAEHYGWDHYVGDTSPSWTRPEPTAPS